MFKKIYYYFYWKYYYWKHPEDRHLTRSKIWDREIRKLLLEDLQSMKFTKVINDQIPTRKRVSRRSNARSQEVRQRQRAGRIAEKM